MPNEPTIIDVQVPAHNDGADDRLNKNGRPKQRIYSRLLGDSKCSGLSELAPAERVEAESTTPKT